MYAGPARLSTELFAKPLTTRSDKGLTAAAANFDYPPARSRLVSSLTIRPQVDRKVPRTTPSRYVWGNCAFRLI